MQWRFLETAYYVLTWGLVILGPPANKRFRERICLFRESAGANRPKCQEYIFFDPAKDPDPVKALAAAANNIYASLSNWCRLGALEAV